MRKRIEWNLVGCLSDRRGSISFEWRSQTKAMVHCLSKQRCQSCLFLSSDQFVLDEKNTERHRSLFLLLQIPILCISVCACEGVWITSHRFHPVSVIIYFLLTYLFALIRYWWIKNVQWWSFSPIRNSECQPSVSQQSLFAFVRYFCQYLGVRQRRTENPLRERLLVRKFIAQLET